MTWQEQLQQLGDDVERRIRRLWLRHEDGQVDRDGFVTLAAALIARQQARAVSAADVAVAGTIARRLGRAASPVGLQFDDDQPRLRAAVRTTVEYDAPTIPDDELSRSRQDRLSRVARAETYSAGQTATQQAWTAHGVAGGWVRQTDQDPCPACTNWADGVVRSWSVAMNRHPSCACLPVPAL